MRRFVTVVCVALIIFGTAVGAMADGRGTLFNNGNPTYSGIVDANDEFQQALVDNPGDQTVMLFLAVTKLAVFGLENGSNPAVLQTFRDLYEAFGISRSDAESIMEAPITDPPTVFEEYDPPDTMPNGDEFQNFLAGPFLNLIENELIPLVDGISNDSEFKVNITALELGDESGVEIDYGDVLLLRSFLYTLKAFILLVDSYDMDELNIQEVAVLINADVMQLQRDIFDPVTGYANFLNLKSSNSLDASKAALVAAIDTWQEAYGFILAETDEQADDLFAFGSQEEIDEAEGIRDMMDAFKTSLDDNQPMEIEDVDIRRMDFNRIFGNDGKPAADINYYLPEFDVYDEPLPGTFLKLPKLPETSGLVLGGFFPDMLTDDDATKAFDLQPGKFYAIPNRTVTFSGNITADWLSNELLHTDIEGDTDITGADIEKVYLAKDPTYLYVGMTLYDGAPNPAAVVYGLGFRNSDGDGYMPLKLFAVYDPDSLQWIAGVNHWDNDVFTAVGSVAVGTNCIEWKIPLSEITSLLDNQSLSGKFVSTGTLSAENGNYLDLNETRIQLDPETLSDNFTCQAYAAPGKIFIKVMGEPDPFSDSDLGSTWVAGSTDGTYTINGLPAGQDVYVYAFWDKDDNGVITYPDYGWGTPDDSPLTIQAVTNSLNIDITQSIIDIVGPFEVIGSIMYVHLPDDSFKTYYSVDVGNFNLGHLPGGVNAVTVKAPDGTVLLNKDDFEFDGEWDEFFAMVDGVPQIGTYTFSVTAGGDTVTTTDTQAENRVIPLPDTNSFVPAAGTVVDSMTPVFSWDAVDFEDAFYRFEIIDQWGNRVYATSRMPGMLSAVVPQWKLNPGQTYYWRVRVTDSDNWADIQNRANSAWVEFTMADTLSHDATPALDLDSYGVVTFSNENGILGLDFWVKVIDHDGVAFNSETGQASHAVVITFPDTSFEPMDFNYSENTTSGYYSYWYSLDSTQLAELQASSKTFIFTVTDPDGNQGEATDVLTVNPLDAIDEGDFSITTNGTTPTFTWDNNVEGANTYRVRIYTDDLSRTLWSKSIGDVGTYTVPPGVLAPNATYRYRIDARDSHFNLDIDNVSRAPARNSENIQFTTGNETEAPYIDLANNGVFTWNHPDVENMLSFWIKVHDAEGVPDNIKSVKVRLPDYATSGQEALLYFDYNESGTCGVYQGESLLPIQPGPYTFVVEDNEGHITERSEQLDINCLKEPDPWFFDIQPQPDGDGTGFNFTWGPVEPSFSGFYRLEIYNRDYNRIYMFPTMDTQYHLPPGFLKKHELYSFRITVRREFFDQNVDNGASMPWGSDNRPTLVAVPLTVTGGGNTPSIDLDSWGAVLYHYPHPIDGTDDKYRLGFSVKVSDANGVPKNIKSVTVTDVGTGETLNLNYDSKISDTEAYYWLWVEIENPYDLNGKQYTFTVTDADDNVSNSVTDTLDVDVLDIPRGLKPADGSSFYGTCPEIQWDKVGGASIYRVRIYDGLYDTLHKGGYVEDLSYTVPPGVLDLNQIFSYRIRACREDFRQDGVDLDNLSCSELLATSIQPHVTTSELDLGGSILTLKTVAGMASEGINTSADMNEDGKIGLAEAIYGLQKEADLR